MLSSSMTQQQQRQTQLASPIENGTPISKRQHVRILAMVVTILLVVVFTITGIVNFTESFKRPDNVKVRTVAIVRDPKYNAKGDQLCSSICDAHRDGAEQRNEKTKKALHGMDQSTLSRTDMVRLVRDAKDRLIVKLKKDYGDVYFERIFVDDGDNTYRPFMPISPAGPSMDRLKQKLMIKALSVQLALTDQRASFIVDGCDCTQHRTRKVELDGEETNGGFPLVEKYVWATGGHSAAAGHGNLFNESYTAFLESDMKDVFGSIGIEFEGRNYAMGGTSSSAEVAMCWEQIFGNDVDFFSWDFGMTDGEYVERLLHYGYRGGLSSGLPAMLGVHVGGRRRTRLHREGSLRTLESLGMAAFHGNDDSYETMRNGIPDMEGLSMEDIQKVPEYVRSFKCGGAIEQGEPFCGDEKFSNYICVGRSRRSGWHPGIKDHAMTGHGMALFLTNALLGALQDLEKHDNHDGETLLGELRKNEEELYHNFTNATLPDIHRTMYSVKDGVVIQPEFDSSVFFTGHSFCHTGRVPSQTRYLGYLTNSTDKVGGPAPYGYETYDTGINVEFALRSPSPNGEMRLVWAGGKEREISCPVTCKPDYKDVFLTTSLDGWTKLTIPNEAERTAYRYDPSRFKGIIIMILRGCDFGKCERGFLKQEQYDEKKWEMKVNGLPVVSVVDIGFEALLVVGEDGRVHFPPTANGEYDIEVQVLESGSFVKVSSFILY